MWYADASFLASVFGQDANTPAALHWLRTCTVFPIIVSRLTLLEVETAFRAAVQGGHLTAAEREQARRRMERGFRDGILLQRELLPHQWFPQAHRITLHATPLSTCRALDVLHIAAAILKKASGFLSFDHHQRVLATAEGLVVAP